MSYSFNFRAATVVAAAAMLATKFDEVVASQPVHEKDRAVATAAAEAVIGLLPEPSDEQEVMVSVAGYVGWAQAIEAGGVPDELTAASVTASAHLVPKSE